MTKAELIQTVAENHPNLSKTQVEAVLTTTFDTFAEQLGKNEKVAWTGFGSFETTHRAARDGRNPKTGAKIAIAASKSVKFKLGKKLKEGLNS